jgi:hypothetical protein
MDLPSYLPEQFQPPPRSRAISVAVCGVASFASDMLSADLGGIIDRVIAAILGSVVIQVEPCKR